MTHAKSGDTVEIHYTGTLEDGDEFDSSAGGEPLEFAMGSGQVIAGFDNAVDDMTPEVGMQLQSQSPDGQIMNLIIAEVTEESITVDANHPLAGQALTFAIELVEIS